MLITLRENLTLIFPPFTLQLAATTLFSCSPSSAQSTTTHADTDLVISWSRSSSQVRSRLICPLVTIGMGENNVDFIDLLTHAQLIPAVL